MHSSEDRGRLTLATAGSVEARAFTVVLGTRDAKPTGATVGFALSGVGYFETGGLHPRLVEPATRATGNTGHRQQP